MPTAPDAFVFDAYGTLFDPYSVTGLAERLAPGKGAALSQLWRSKQLEYTWLGSLMQQRHDFGVVTAEALDYALAMLAIPLNVSQRQALLDAWLTLEPYPDALAALTKLAPRPRWILSNGTRAMLDPLVQGSGLGAHLDGVLSVDPAGVYKPHPAVYRLAVERLALPPARIGFVSANCWDAIGARAFGFHSWWISRNRAPVDRHAAPPDRIVHSLLAVADEVPA